MRIHSDILTTTDFRRAASVARVDFTSFGKGVSRSHRNRFEVILTGESRRRQNGGTDYAATWDQWGVFLGCLFNVDSDMVCGSVKRPVYADECDFNFKTGYRFFLSGANGIWPTDAHGDHKFQYSGIPFQQNCTKCSASQRWL